MRKIIFPTAGLGFALTLLLGCTAPAKAHREAHKVMQLSDGRYAYNDDGVWYYWMMANALSASSPAPTVAVQSGASPPTPTQPGVVPSGGTWARGSPPTAEEAETATEIGETEVAEDADGEPVTETASADETTSPDSSSVADSSSSGGDSGGGGGGDSGGGGE